MSDVMPTAALPTMADVEAAALRLAPWIRRTPVLRVQGPGARDVVFKLEGLQRSGSFKLRGALNKVMLLGDAAREGVVTASGGNHGIGVAWAAWFLGLRAHVCVPSTSPPWKLQALSAANAEVEIVSGRYPDAELAARAYARAHALPYVHAYDDAAVIAGQGTLVRELLADAPDVGTIVVAVGGGGLVAGAVVAAAGRRIVGVEPYGAPTMHAALRADTPITLEHIESVAADALGAGRVGDLPFHLCREGLDRVELVDDGAILEARRWLWAHTRIAVEAGAAAGVAALARGLFDRDPGPVGIILCGSNTDPTTLA
ncbi:pyridoxal-phosphate dependent enzyme [Myxococcota bacterium]|nr:pyridoxal-phosphate dependent enzyme [Myxococcota bacterium]